LRSIIPIIATVSETTIYEYDDLDRLERNAETTQDTHFLKISETAK